MSPKTAIIILLTLFLIGIFIFVYLFAAGHFFLKQQPKTINQPTGKEPIEKQVLTPEKARQKIIEDMAAVEEKNPTIITDPVEKEKARQKIIEDMAAVEEKNPTKK